jgi:hypothetical protein
MRYEALHPHAHRTCESIAQAPTLLHILIAVIDGVIERNRTFSTPVAINYNSAMSSTSDEAIRVVEFSVEESPTAPTSGPATFYS